MFAAYYCPEATPNLEAAQLCTPGHYCPGGQTFPLPCPAGTYNNLVGRDAQDDCLTCFAGRYCNSSTDTPGCASCACPKGHYCAAGVTEPVACPWGSYTEEDGASSVSQCGSCWAGYYCPSGKCVKVGCDGVDIRCNIKVILYLFIISHIKSTWIYVTYICN